MVMEYVAQGTLHAFLRHPPSTQTRPAGASGSSPQYAVPVVLTGAEPPVAHASLSDTHLHLRFALDTARGMAHLHALGRIHRDLKTSVSTALLLQACGWFFFPLSPCTCM
jgi:serine/threonine protein kinase